MGQLSPDGAWRWDGQQWVPTGQGPTPYRHGSRRWLWWLAGGCALTLLMSIAGGVWVVTTIAHSFQTGAASCLPSDFPPRYPGSTVADYNYRLDGNRHMCVMTYQSGHGHSEIESYYESHLDTGDWKVSTADSEGGLISFYRRSNPTVSGLVHLYQVTDGTQIVVTLRSS